MPLTRDDQALITTLSNRLAYDAPRLRALNDEYEMRVKRAYMHPDVRAELGERIESLVLAWPRLVTGALEERLDVDGFRLPRGEGDDDLWRVWQENDGDEESQKAILDALVMGRSYMAIGTNDEDADTPLITFESPLEIWADIDPRTRQVRRAVRVYGTDHDYLNEAERYATVYERERTSYYDITGGTGSWTLLDRDEHHLGVVPIVPIINGGRLGSSCGWSELEPILPLARAAAKLATDMMVAAEFVAIPMRGIFGVSPADFEDAQGNALSPMKVLMGRLLAIPDDEKVARQFEFASAQLSNFHESIKQLAMLVASLSALPPDYLGLTTENPPSAEARLAGEVRLIKRAERKQRAFGGSFEQGMRIVRRLQEGSWDPKWRRLETQWRDASTPTVAQTADAAVKKYAAGIVSLPQTREDLGYTDAQIERMEADDEKKAAQDPIAALTSAAGRNLPEATATGEPAAE